MTGVFDAPEKVQRKAEGRSQVLRLEGRHGDVVS